MNSDNLKVQLSDLASTTKAEKDSSPTKATEKLSAFIIQLVQARGIEWAANCVSALTSQQQLAEEQKQNTLLKEQCETLKKLQEKTEQEAVSSKKYNRKMFWIALGAGIIALGSLIANGIMIWQMSRGG